MRKFASPGDIIAWPFLLPGNIASRAIGSDEHSSLVRNAGKFAGLDRTWRRGGMGRRMMGQTKKHDRVSEDNIRQLVDAFYVKVRADPELGPVFATAIPGDWQPHLEKMYAFWSSVMLTSGRYKGNPVVKHFAVAGMKFDLFAVWLKLFGETCDDMFDDTVSTVFREKANRIAESLKLALFYRPDRVWPPQTSD